MRSTSSVSATAASTTAGRRVQNETLQYRGRNIICSNGSGNCCRADEQLDERGAERRLLGLRVGDPNDELLGALARRGERMWHLPRRRFPRCTSLE
jgi:hypothetical protein